MHTQSLRAVASINCNGCRANAHSENERNELIHVVGTCGDKQTLGGCFGVVMYPIKNPSEAAHFKLMSAVKTHAEKIPAVRVITPVIKQHIIGLSEHFTSASNALDSAAA